MNLKCQYCENNFLSENPNRRFCNKSCSNKWRHSQGLMKNFRRNGSVYDCWVRKFGTEKANQLLVAYQETMKVSISNADMSHQKEVARLKMVERNQKNSGKNLEEIYGEQKAKKIRDKLSASTTGSKNPAFGKSYTSGGRSIKGYYKGRFFRSLFEYSFMKHLESIGRSLQEDIDYESFTIPYLKNGIERTYRIDFFDKKSNIAYEVKPFYVTKMKKLLEDQEVKWDAATTFFQTLGIAFKVVTENEFRKIPFTEAILDQDVTWKEETFKYFEEK